MKSTLNNQETSEKQKYPKLMIDKEYGMVVLFADECNGTCLHAGTATMEEVGNYEDYSSDDWNDYTGTITLEN